MTIEAVNNFKKLISHSMGFMINNKKYFLIKIHIICAFLMTLHAIFNSNKIFLQLNSQFSDFHNMGSSKRNNSSEEVFNIWL